MKIIVRSIMFIAFLFLGGLIFANPANAGADATAPGSPTELGGFPATLTASDRFTVFWDNPADPSGIAAAWYKFDTAPTTNTDGTKISPVEDPKNNSVGLIKNLATGGRVDRTIYIWLEDGVGNKDYNTAKSTILRPEGSADAIIRIAGPDRFATAVEISHKVFPVDKTAGAVVLANGFATADALAGVPLGFMANAPVLLIKEGQIPSNVYMELQRVLPNGGRIYLLGGSGVINQTQEIFLTSQGYDVKRLAGDNRMITSIKILEELDILRGSSPTRLYIANGHATADALSVAPLAAFQEAGIALTEPGDLTQVIRDYLNVNLNTLSTVTIVGGTKVVPQSVTDLLSNAGYVVTRLAGATRYDTSRIIADLFVDDAPLSPPGIAIANGYSPADALPAGVHAAAQLYPLLLIPNDLAALVCSNTYDYMADYNANITGGYAYGGSAVLAESVVNTAMGAIGGSRIPCGTFGSSSGGGNPSAGTAGPFGFDGIDKNCSDFTSQKQAQNYFNSDGGSASNNIDGLDSNGNGIACESLP